MTLRDCLGRRLLLLEQQNSAQAKRLLTGPGK